LVPATNLSHARIAQQLSRLLDESWEKLPYFASRRVDEVLIVDPAERRIDWLVLQDGRCEPAERSELVDLTPRELAAQLD
jgi:hypothetical protein